MNSNNVIDFTNCLYFNAQLRNKYAIVHKGIIQPSNWSYLGVQLIEYRHIEHKKFIQTYNTHCMLSCGSYDL